MEDFIYTSSLCNYLTLLNNGPGWAETRRRLITGNYGVIPETSVFVGFNVCEILHKYTRLHVT
jgi:hypothetical protein